MQTSKGVGFAWVKGVKEKVTRVTSGHRVTKNGSARSEDLSHISMNSTLPDTASMLDTDESGCASSRLPTQSEAAAFTPGIDAPDDLTMYSGRLQHAHAVHSVTWRPDSRAIATASLGKRAAIWNSSGVHVQKLAGHTHSLTGAAWSPTDSCMLATASSDKTAAIWDARSGARTALLQMKTAAVRALAWSPDGATLATASDDGYSATWTAANGWLTCRRAGHRARIVALTWDPSGSILATASADKTVRLWAVATDCTAGTDSGAVEQGTIVLDACALAWSPDGSSLAAVGTDGVARLWDHAAAVGGAAAAESTVTVNAGPGVHIVSVAWSPGLQQGRKLALGTRAGQVVIWDAATRVRGVALADHTACVHAVAWSPDGQMIATASSDCSAIVWDVAYLWEAAGAHTLNAQADTPLQLVHALPPVAKVRFDRRPCLFHVSA